MLKIHFTDFTCCVDFESSDTDEGDRISVRVMLDLSDEKYSSLTADDELWFGISARFGNSQIWLANLATNISEPEPDNLNETASLVSDRCQHFTKVLAIEIKFLLNY